MPFIENNIKVSVNFKKFRELNVIDFNFCFRCWNTHPTSGYFWILRGPIVISVVVNIIISINGEEKKVLS